jgi:putative ABC transport system permease protein
MVLPGYFETLRIPMLAGRDVADLDRMDAPRVLVVSELMARTLFPGQSAMGRRVMVNMDGASPIAFEVVGVVGDARINAMGRPARMAMYASFYQFPRMTMRFAVRTGLAPDVLGGTVRRVVAARDRNIPVENLSSMERFISDSLVSQRVTAITLTLFSTAAMLLASLGLYGVLTYYVTQRTHEIGVRMALGADRRAVMRHVLARSGGLVVPGLVLGVVVSLWGVRLIGRLLYDVPPTDPATFAIVSACLAVVAFAASALPAWRAARIDPMRVLRGE